MGVHYLQTNPYVSMCFNIASYAGPNWFVVGIIKEVNFSDHCRLKQTLGACEWCHSRYMSRLRSRHIQTIENNYDTCETNTSSDILRNKPRRLTTGESCTIFVESWLVSAVRNTATSPEARRYTSCRELYTKTCSNHLVHHTP